MKTLFFILGSCYFIQQMKLEDNRWIPLLFVVFGLVELFNAVKGLQQIKDK